MCDFGDDSGRDFRDDTTPVTLRVSFKQRRVPSFFELISEQKTDKNVCSTVLQEERMDPPIKDFEDYRGDVIPHTPFCHSRVFSCHSRDLYVIPAKAGIQEVFLFSLMLILTPNPYSHTERAYLYFCLIRIYSFYNTYKNLVWIPNQVGDDKLLDPR